MTEPGDICPNCELIGVAGALCQKHAAADECIAMLKTVSLILTIAAINDVAFKDISQQVMALVKKLA